MADIIQLMPESMANQIAAGEVVQRPASVVKELLENALDSGADKIKLVVEEGGTKLVAVIDNGSGMSRNDARMCWERHATSKIKNIDDLFKLHTFGFRGEALASIAAVARVELKTKRDQDDIGSWVIIEASQCIEQQPIALENGTQIFVKNLFYNVPARKNFLKSISIEQKHIVEEFIRVALSKPNIELIFVNNGREIYHLPKQKLGQRIVDLMNVESKHLLPVQEETDIAKIYGYVLDPTQAKGSRGNQYLFANQRFFKSSYFHHAIGSAFSGLIEEKKYPSYVIFIEVDPKSIDVNVHPTKTELNFQEGKSIYAILMAGVKRALGTHFMPKTQNQSFTKNTYHPVTSEIEYQKPISSNTVGKSSQYNPQEGMAATRKVSWDLLFENPQKNEEQRVQNDLLVEINQDFRPFQLAKKYIVVNQNNSLLVINQSLAHQRIIYDKLSHNKESKIATQQMLFPRTFQFAAQEFSLVESVILEFQKLGFDVSVFGKNAIIMNGAPAEIEKSDVADVFKAIVDEYLEDRPKDKALVSDKLRLLSAKSMAIKNGMFLTEGRMQALVKDLLQCSEPKRSPGGRNIMISFAPSDLEKLMN